MAQNFLAEMLVEMKSEKGELMLEPVAEEIVRLLETGEQAEVRRFLESLELADVASVVEELPQGDDLTAIRLLALHDQAALIGHFRPSAQVSVAERLGKWELVSLMGAMSHDERADLFKQLDETAQEMLLPAFSKAEREDLRRLAAHEEWTVGSVMTSDYAVLAPELTSTDAITALRRQALDAETIYYAYIIGESRELLGVISLRDLLTAPPRQRVADLMDTEPVQVYVSDPQGEAARLVARYDLLALPVLDEDDRLVGIVTADDAMDVSEEEVTEDFHKGSTIQPFDMSVADATISKLYRARIFLAGALGVWQYFLRGRHCLF